MRSASDFCSYYHIQLKPAPQALLDDALTPRQYLDRLRSAGCLPEARRVLAHALPRRRALWWGCLCAWDGCQPATATLSAAIQAVVRYCIEPGEDQRRAARAVSRAVRGDSLAHCLAMAAFLSGGSVSQPTLPFVGPKPYLTGRLVSVVVYLAAVRRQPARYKQQLDRYLDLGLELAAGPDPWLDSCQLSAISYQPNGSHFQAAGERQTPLTASR